MSATRAPRGPIPDPLNSPKRLSSHLYKQSRLNPPISVEPKKCPMALGEREKEHPSQSRSREPATPCFSTASKEEGPIRAGARDLNATTTDRRNTYTRYVMRDHDQNNRRRSSPMKITDAREVLKHHEDVRRRPGRSGPNQTGGGGGGGPVQLPQRTGRRRHHWRRRWRPYRGQQAMDGERTPYRRRGEDMSEWETRRSRWLKKHPLPEAPYNSNQFLIDDRNSRDTTFKPNFEEISKILQHQHPDTANISTESEPGPVQGPRRRCHSESTPSRARPEDEDGIGRTSSDEFYSSPDDEQDYLERQFSEAYDNIHVERLSSKSKNDLIDDYLLLERRIEELESKLTKERISHQAAGGTKNVPGISDVGGESEPLSGVILRRLRSESESTEDRIVQLQVEMKRLQSENQKMKCLMADRTETMDSNKDCSTCEPVGDELNEHGEHLETTDEKTEEAMEQDGHIAIDEGVLAEVDTNTHEGKNT